MPRGAATWVTLAIALAAAPAAAAPPAGFDLFETDPEATKFRFRHELTLPAGFFAPGSRPFEGDVHFGGVPVNVFEGRDVGDADTIWRRRRPATLPGPGSSDTVPLEIVALSLVSSAPITVQVGGTTQTWDVSAKPSPSRSSTGLMTIRQTSAQGGSFDHFLDVFPSFTFERRSDGQTRVLDVGTLPLSLRAQRKLRLLATNTPWSGRCVDPALSVRGVNDGFCPGFARGRKRLTAALATLAEHGIRPAQPRVEHFKCYGIRSRTRFRPRTVALRDQFGAQRARVVRPVELCNPVRKNRERLVNRRAHLKCYSIRSPRFQRRLVAVRNQFGPEFLTVVRPRTLCLPSLKRLGARRRPFPSASRAVFTDHFKCYDVRSQASFRARRVRLLDQFRLERATVLRPVLLCAPVQKNRQPIRHAVQHLVCYQIRAPGRFRPRLARVRNQFGTELVVALRPKTLCVPSAKLRLPPPFQPPPPSDPPPPPPPPPPPDPPNPRNPPNPPSLTDTDPDSPANDNAPRVKGSAAAGSTVRVSTNPACTGAPVATGSAADFAAPGLQASVANDSTTAFYATATDPAGNASGCSAPLTYVEDSTAPAAPVLTDTDPDSPANDNAPRVKGSAAAGSTVRLYTNPACTGAPVATGSAADFAAPGLQASVANDSTTAFYATATDPARNASGCSAPLTYVEDSTAPAVPSLTDTDPDSPANDNSPEVKGSAAAGSTVRVYTNAACTGAVAAQGSAADFASPGLTVAVPDNSTTTFYASASDQAGNASGCSPPIAYVEDSRPPGPCTAGLQRGMLVDSIRWFVQCQGAIDRIRLITPGRQILSPTGEPSGATCATTTTTTPNDTRECSGSFTGMIITGEFQTNPPTATNQGAQGAAMNGTAQTSLNFVGPNP